MSRLIEGLLFLLFGLAGIGEGYRLANKVGSKAIKDAVGPGYYVLSLGVILVIIGIVHLGAARKQSGLKKPASKDRGPSDAAGANVPLMCLAFALYVALIYLFGYVISTLIFFLFEFRLAGVRNWKSNIIATAVVTGAFYVVFAYYCDLVFPHGLLVQRLLE